MCGPVGSNIPFVHSGKGEGHLPANGSFARSRKLRSRAKGEKKRKKKTKKKKKEEEEEEEDRRGC